MPIAARYAHTNLVAHDWRSLAAFYCDVFGCEALLPERHLGGAWLDSATGLEGARIDGVHLRLPGHGANGPTLEVFQYGAPADGVAAAPHRTGWGHIAFAVSSVPDALAAVIANGGAAVGEVVTLPVAGVGRVTFVYARDPEGNIIELQSWEQAAS